MIFALYHHLLESTLFAVLAGLFTLAWRKRGAGIRHAIWFVAALKFAVPAGLLFALGANIRGLLSLSVARYHAPDAISKLLVARDAYSQGVADHVVLFRLLIVTWLGGSLLMVIAWLPRLLTSLRLSSCADAEYDNDEIIKLKRRVRLRRAVGLQFSARRMEPVLTGFWRPTITISSELSSQLTAAELNAVLLHELAHAKRFDNWTGAFSHLLTCLFWFHPVLWWIEKSMSFERELACDEIVVRCGAAPEDYVASILKVCRFHLNGPLAGTSGVAGSNLKTRLEFIMSLSPGKAVLAFPKSLIGLMASLVTLVPLAIGFSAQSNVHAQSSKQSMNGANGVDTISCVFDGTEYSEGTVIQVKGSSEQVCARTLTIKDSQRIVVPTWIFTSKSIRERGKNIVSLPTPTPFVCIPKASTDPTFCACKDAQPFSLGSEANSVNGRLHCDAGNWIASEAAEAKSK
jgi:bla regulator protein blaR1